MNLNVFSDPPSDHLASYSALTRSETTKGMAQQTSPFRARGSIY